jgi:hypothetical protein
MKRINKALNKEFTTLKKLKQLTWNDLNLPKPRFKVSIMEYGDVIN